MQFTKLHGAGNDFICLSEPVTNPAELARGLCNRRSGIGADGLLLLAPSKTANFRMTVFNADGSRASMCGNGIRCAAKYACAHGLAFPDAGSISVETDAGIRTVTMTRDDSGAVTDATVDMGAPAFGAAYEVEYDGTPYSLLSVSMGNPHALLFLDCLDKALLRGLGPMLQTHPLFPDGVNLELVRIVDPAQLEVLVWERGAGETQSCGTGACAALAAAAFCGRSAHEADVTLPGGTLHIRWDKESRHMFLTGPVVAVYDGALS